MIKFGRLRLNYEADYDEAHHLGAMVLNICEKTYGSYTEILVNKESYSYQITVNGSVVSSEGSSSDIYNVYIGRTLEEVISKHANSSYTRTWEQSMTEVGE